MNFNRKEQNLDLDENWISGMEERLGLITMNKKEKDIEIQGFKRNERYSQIWSNIILIGVLGEENSSH